MACNEPRLEWVLSHLMPGDDVLDVGCHKGEVTAYLWAGTTGRVTGVDISAPCIRVAAQFYRDIDIEWLVADAEALPLADDRFDLVVLTEILEHVIDPDAVIREAERVCRPGGRIVVSAPKDAMLMDLGGRFKAELQGAMPLDGHVREYRPEVALAGKPGMVTSEGGTGGGLYWRMAAYQVVKKPGYSAPPNTPRVPPLGGVTHGP